MSGEKDLIKPAVTPFRGEKIHIQKVPIYNRDQFKRVLEVLKAANMTFYEAAKAGLHLGYPVSVAESDAPIKSGSWEDQPGKVKEEDDKIIAWQRRGEMVGQMENEVNFSLRDKIAVISHDLTVPGSEGVIEVIEGIEISVEKEAPVLEQPEPSELANYDVQAAADQVVEQAENSLDTNFYLQAPAIIKR